MGQRLPSRAPVKTHLNLLEICEFSFGEPRTVSKQGIWRHQIQGY